MKFLKKYKFEVIKIGLFLKYRLSNEFLLKVVSSSLNLCYPNELFFHIKSGNRLK